MPGAKQAWPNVAACWSPALPAIGIGAPKSSGCDSPTTSLDDVIRGSNARGTLKSCSSSSSQSSVARSTSSVRDALLTSVTWTAPPVRFQMSQLSMVPKASSPRSARARAPGTWSSSHAIFVAEKYGSSTNPVFARKRSSRPRSRNAAQCSAVRRSCQTMALAIGAPVARSHSTVVSRWLVMPMPATSWAGIPACRSADCAQASCVDQISLASCSTQPGCG